MCSMQYRITLIRATQVLLSSIEIKVACLQESNITNLVTKFRVSFVLKHTLVMFYVYGHETWPLTLREDT